MFREGKIHGDSENGWFCVIESPPLNEFNPAPVDIVYLDENLETVLEINDLYKYAGGFKKTD